MQLAEYQAYTDAYNDKTSPVMKSFGSVKALHNNQIWKRKGVHKLSDLLKHINAPVQIGAMRLLEQMGGDSEDVICYLGRGKYKAFWRIVPEGYDKFAVIMGDGKYLMIKKEADYGYN